MTSPKKIIFTPAGSTHAVSSWLKKNIDIRPNIPARIYAKDFPIKRWYHPYFLITAGANYKSKDFRNSMGLEDVFVIGDSGGYQIATGALKWNNSIRENIFNWLETNSDVALNIDIPPKGLYEGKFEESLAVSIENFKYFESHQSGKTKFLNVLHGVDYSIELMTKWYDSVKDFKFNGWALGETGTISNILGSLAMLQSGREFDKSNIQYLHFLGVSTLYHMIILIYIQQILNKYTNNKVQITFDSSSAFMNSMYGIYFHSGNWSKLLLKLLHLNRGTNVDVDTELPCTIDCEYCRGLKMNDIKDKSESLFYQVVGHHNLCMQLKLIRDAEQIMSVGDSALSGFLGNKMFKLFKSIDEIFESNDPLKKYASYLPLYRSLENDDKLKTDLVIANDFFDF